MSDPQYDPDERFTLDPATGEEVRRRLLGVDDECEDEPEEGEGSKE